MASPTGPATAAPTVIVRVDGDPSPEQVERLRSFMENQREAIATAERARILAALPEALEHHRRNKDGTMCSCGQAFFEVEREDGERVWQSWEVHVVAALAAAIERQLSREPGADDVIPAPIGEHRMRWP